MVSPMRLTVPSAALIQVSFSANPNQLKTERLENNLDLWSVLADQLKVLFPDGDDEGPFIIPTLRCSLTCPQHQRSKKRDWKTPCSNLPPLEVDKLLPLLRLICLFLVFLLKCCNVFSLRPSQPMCDGRLFASPLFRRLACRGAFSAVSRSDGFYTLLSL